MIEISQYLTSNSIIKPQQQKQYRPKKKKTNGTEWSNQKQHATVNSVLTKQQKHTVEVKCFPKMALRKTVQSYVEYRKQIHTHDSAKTQVQNGSKNLIVRAETQLETNIESAF